MTFGKILRTAREKSNLSQEDTAKAIEKRYGIRMSPSYLSMIENGSRDNLTIKTLSALLDFFDLPFHSVVSLFKASGRHIVLETQHPYSILPPDASPEQLAMLPDEAKMLIKEFTQYLIAKYRK